MNLQRYGTAEDRHSFCPVQCAALFSMSITQVQPTVTTGQANRTRDKFLTSVTMVTPQLHLHSTNIQSALVSTPMNSITAMTRLVGQQKGHLASTKLGVGLLVVTT